MAKRLAGKVIVVTGGTSGIGRAIAVRLAAEGASVVVGARGAEAGAQVVAQIHADGGEALFAASDVTVPDDAAALVQTAIDRYGRLDGAVNNAGGVPTTGPIAGTTEDDWRSALEQNLSSVFFGLKHQLPAIAAAGGGSIVNNASIAAVIGIPGLGAYVAAKHGVIGLTRSAALECAGQGVRVNALVTGNVDTPLYRSLLNAGPDDDLGKAPNPTGRTADPAEIAAYVAFLLSDESRFITGAALPIDGGATAG